MADASKLKQLRRPGLGVPPSLQEAKDLSPEPPPPPPSGAPPAEPPPPPAPVSRLDGRSLRRSGRTIQFATRVSPDFDARVRTLAQRDGLLLVEVLEKALDAYEKAFR